ncbi:uncharacterized protein UTRI_03602_B [Ustilago trichophora]|uniref:SYO1-like TPR repeats domain-containing protein n=1 Tax=Ustilago trichophora TaxID=86804 RepID=A0A5C3E2N7_9BASI|nr:uncharacterized protein UTRI_03602_B [Ustilago trichophora]
MPKSGFDPQRHQRKVHRHNPLSKSNSSSAAPSPPSVSSATLDALQQAAKAANSPSSSKTAAASNDIVPLLANLPASETSSAAAPINLADKVWSLASVSLLLSVSPTQSAAEVKHHRKLLLSHNLIGRLILALQSHTEVDVRREASGALRNLCVDSGVDVRNEVVNKGGVPAILAAMRWASNALGFDASASSSSNANPAISFVDDAPTQEQDLEAKRALLAKPLDKMNKKEKRHATKLATALGKTLEQVAGQGLSAEDEQKLVSSSSSTNDAMDTTNGAASGRGEPFLALDSNTRKGLIEMAENLVTVVWCLCESGDKAFAKLVAWKWLDQDIVGAGASQELSGEGLASWLSSAIALGSRAASVLSTAGADGSRASSSLSQGSAETLGALSNEELSLLLDLALASGNALCALTDGGEADFVDGLLSRKSASPPSKSSKKKSSSSKPDSSSASTPVPQTLDEQPPAATRRLTAIQSALTLLQACVNTDQNSIDKLKRYILAQTTMLGVLSAGIFRNIAAAVDTKAATSGRGKSSRKHGGANASSVTSASIFVGEGVTLKKLEESVILPTLTRLLAGVDMSKLAHDLDGRGDVNEAVPLDSNNKDGLDEAALRMKLQGKAEEKAQTLMLALEVVAEMAASLDSRAGGGGADDEEDEEWLEDLEADEEGDDEDMDMGGDDEDDEDKEEDMDAMLTNKEDDDMGVRGSNNNANDTFADAVKRSGTLPFEAYAPILTSLFSASSDVSLTAALLAIARPFEASFPSLSPSGPSDKPTSGLLRGLHLRSLSVLNNLLLRLAAFSPPPPSQPATDPKILRRIAAFRTWTQTHPQSTTLTEVWSTLFDIAKGCASVPAVATAGAGIVSPANDSDGVMGSAGSLATASSGNGEGLDGLGMVETCIGTMWSLARVLEGSVALSSASSSVTVSDPNASTSEIITALVSGYTSASTDSMRVKCILLLSTIARSPQIHPSLNAFLGNFLVSILESIPEHPSSSTLGTTAESMVAAINGIIDTYADETSPYDATAFRSANLLGRLRLTVFRCKALARQIDRRKQISLRASAEEALENLTGFIQYRQSLRF